MEEKRTDHGRHASRRLIDIIFGLHWEVLKSLCFAIAATMIRSSTSRLREKASKQYICWQCQSKARKWTPSSAVRLASNATRSSPGYASVRLEQRHFNAGRTVC